MGNADSIPVELRHRVFNLVIQARNNIGNLRSDALREIWLLTENDDYKIPLCDSSLQFLPLIRDILTNSLNDQISLKNTIACICNLSTHQQNKMIICNPQLGILSALVNLMDETNGILVQDTNAKKWLYTTLSNCALNPITHPYLLADPTVRYLEVLKTEMERDPSYLPPIKSFGCISLSLPNHYAHLIINLRVHEIIVNRLMTFGPIPSQWQDRNTGMAYWSLNFITAFSGLPEGRKALRALNKVDYFLQLLSCTEMEGIKASIITSNIFVQEDMEISSPLQSFLPPSSLPPSPHLSSSSNTNGLGGGVNGFLLPMNVPSPHTSPTSSVLVTKSLLESFPQLFPTLMDVYSATLDFDANRSEVKSLLSRGFGYAIVKMRDLSATLRNLSISSDKNKEIMLNHPSTLLFVLKSIHLFIDNKPELNAIYHNYREYAGGGGKDFETINYLMELLLQLSFFYKSDEMLLKFFLKPIEYNMISMLQSFLSLSYDRNVPYEATQYANLLLKRLLPLQPLSTIPQHIMLSYARNVQNSNHQPLISSLGKRLREMGYDVWNPEEGSYLLSKNTSSSSSSSTSTSTSIGYYNHGFDDYMDIVSRAIDHSYMIIICITPEYPANYYCKMEAKYAKIRQRDHDLKIAYVMLNKDYTIKPNQMNSTTTTPGNNTNNSISNPNQVNNLNTNNNPQNNPNNTTNHNHNSISQTNNLNANGNNSNNNGNNNTNQNNGVGNSGGNGQNLGSCDGWLGMMIGSDQWYPLWETSHIENTVNSLAAIAGNNAKLERNKKILQTRSLPISQGVQTDPIQFAQDHQKTQSQEQPMDWSDAMSLSSHQKQLATIIWSVLHNSNMFVDESSYQFVKSELNRIGVQEANDLLYLSEESKMKILQACKEVPRTKILKAFEQLNQ